MDTPWAGALRLADVNSAGGLGLGWWRPGPAEPAGDRSPCQSGDGEEGACEAGLEKSQLQQEVRQALREALQEELLEGLRRTLGEELLGLRLDLAQRQQQSQKLQLDELYAVRRLLTSRIFQSSPASEAPPETSRQDAALPDPEAASRRRKRHHTWHFNGAAPASEHGTQQSFGPAALLQLPAESLRHVVKAAQQARKLGEDASPMKLVAAVSPSTFAAHTAAVSVSAQAAEWAASRCGSPTRQNSMEVEMKRKESDVTSGQRSVENERWKYDWRHQLQGRISSQLADLQSTGPVSRSLSKFLGPGDSTRHRRVSDNLVKAPAEPKSCLDRFVDSTAFHLCTASIIIANAVFIGIFTDLSVRHAAEIPPRDDPEWCLIMNRGFVGIFVAEVLLRLAAKRLDFLMGEDWKWNVFDFVLAFYSLAEEIVAGFSLTYTRLLRGFRMVRVLRVIRVVRLFRELRLMVCSIIQSLVSLSWALCLLFLIMYLFTICFMHAAVLYFHEPAWDPDTRHALQEFYGGMGSAMFSLLLAISGGIDWGEIVAPLAEVSALYKYLFGFYVLFVIIGVLNVLTSAFVQRACELSRLDRDLVIQSELVSNESFVAEMKGIFEEVDVLGTGCINWDQFRAFIKNEEVQAYFNTQQLDTSDARELFNLLDQDGDGEVCIEEFILGCKKLKGQAKSSDVATLLRESKRANHKHLKVMRKMEAQLGAVCNGLQCAGIALPDISAFYAASPKSGYSSYDMRSGVSCPDTPLPPEFRGHNSVPCSEAGENSPERGRPLVTQV